MFKIKLLISELRGKATTQRRKEAVMKMKTEASMTSLVLRFILKATILSFFGGIVLFPFIYMILVALMPLEQVFQNPDPVGIIPDSFNWGNFVEAFEDGYFFALGNTLMVVSLSIAFQIFVSMLMGYGLAFKKYLFKKAIWWFLLSLLMLPQIALIVGQYRTVIILGIQEGYATLLAMVLPYAASIFSGYMFKNSFELIPQRTKEAALIDGVGDFKYFWKVARPIATPTIWTVGILTAFASWNAYMWPALLAVGSNTFRTPLGIWLFTTATIEGEQGNSLGTAMNWRLAASIIVMLPMMSVYFVFRRRIMDAIARRGSAIKG